MEKNPIASAIVLYSNSSDLLSHRQVWRWQKSGTMSTIDAKNSTCSVDKNVQIYWSYHQPKGSDIGCCYIWDWHAFEHWLWDQIHICFKKIRILVSFLWRGFDQGRQAHRSLEVQVWHKYVVKPRCSRNPDFTIRKFFEKYSI